MTNTLILVAVLVIMLVQLSIIAARVDRLQRATSTLVDLHLDRLNLEIEARAKSIEQHLLDQQGR